MTQNINKLIKPTPLPDVMAQKAKDFDAQVAQANKEYADEQSRLAEQAAEEAAAPIQQVVPVVPQYSGTCAEWMAAAGINDPADAYRLIMRESGCNPSAVNASSGACGVGQQLPCGKWPHQWNDPIGGLVDMQGYVYERYGSWSAAWQQEVTMGWY